MKEQVEKIKNSAIAELSKTETLKELGDLKVKTLGKKGELTTILRGMGSIPKEERPVMGELVNNVRDILEEEFAKKEKELKRKDLEKKIANRKYRCNRAK